MLCLNSRQAATFMQLYDTKNTFYIEESLGDRDTWMF